MLTCLCGVDFEPKRSNQKFCCRKCQKASTHNSARATQNSFYSPTKWRHNYDIYDLAFRLAETYYSVVPGKRLGLINDWINLARAEPGLLREVLSNRTLLRPNPATERWKFHRGSPEYLTISQVANRFCLKMWGYGVVDVVHNRCPEPPTGEVVKQTYSLAA